MNALTSVNWALSAQIFVLRSDAFTVGSSIVGGSDTIGSSDVDIRDWVDLTCQTGEITIRQGFQDNSPLSQYETGMCDLLLKGLTYAPTLNDEVVPGVPIRVVVSHPTYYSQFAGMFEDDFLTETNPTTTEPLFTGYILDAFEDRVENLVKIQAVDDWRTIVNAKMPYTPSGEAWTNMAYAAADMGMLYGTAVGSSPIISTDPAVPILLSEYFDNSVPRQVVSSINLGGPYDWRITRHYTGTIQTSRLVADTPEECVIGVGTVDYTYASTSGNPPPTDKYWRIIVDFIDSTDPAHRQKVYSVDQTKMLSSFNELSLDTYRKGQHTIAGSTWMNASNHLLVGNHNIWKWNETSPPPSQGYANGQFQPRVIRISDIHTGRHLCFYDYLQQTSLSSVLNSIEQKNVDEDEVETITVFEDEASIETYGRHKTEVETLEYADVDWPGNELITQSREPEANVRQADVKLETYNIDLLPNLHDTVQFEKDGTTQFRRVSRRDIHLTPKEWTARIEFFDYTLYEGLGI